VEQIRTYLPAGRARAITLDLVAYIVMSMMQMLAFTPDTDGVLCYGKRNREVGSPARFADIKAWLLDADACPTDHILGEGVHGARDCAPGRA